MKHNTLSRFATLAAALGLGALGAQAATVAEWNFDQGTADTAFSANSATDVSGNNNTMLGYNATYGPSYSADTAIGSGLSLRVNGGQDGYTFNAPVNSWSPSVWTIELTLKLDSINGWRTFVGRDGTTSISGDLESALYFQKTGTDNRFRLNFSTVGGQRYVLNSDFVAEAGKWYGLAGVSDGTTLTMFANKFDGLGYQAVGTLALNSANDNALRATGNWTFGRGWYNGGFTDYITGNMDTIRLSDVALTPDQLLPVPEPSILAFFGLAGLTALQLRRRVNR